MRRLFLAASLIPIAVASFAPAALLQSRRLSLPVRPACSHSRLVSCPTLQTATLDGMAMPPMDVPQEPRRSRLLGMLQAWLRSLRSLWAITARADASLVTGVLVGLASYACFPRLEQLLRLYLELPVGRRGFSSSFTTDVWGAFCPCIGILFATLISSTVDKLWSRQERLREILIEECRELAALTVLLTTAAEADERADQARSKQAMVERQREEAREKQSAREALDQIAEDDALGVSASTTDTATARVLEAATEPAADDTGGVGGKLTESVSARTMFLQAAVPRRQRGGSTDIPEEGALGPSATGDPKASLRCIARHLSTLSRLVWGKGARSSSRRMPPGIATPGVASVGRERGGGEGPGAVAKGASSKDVFMPRWSSWVPLSAAEETAIAYLAELGSMGGGAGSDPLVDLLLLHPPVPQRASEAIEGNGAAWRNANAEARTIVNRLMERRGMRLATLESRPPTAQWVVLMFTGTSLIFAYAVVSISTRPATTIASRCFFTALTGALLTVLRLLLDLAEPFDGGSFSLATENAAGALLAPTRRRLVAALTTKLKAKEPKLLPTSRLQQ